MDGAGVTDSIRITRVANGWVIGDGRASEFTHVATSPDEVAAHIRAWAVAQIGIAPFGTRAALQTEKGPGR